MMQVRSRHDWTAPRFDDAPRAPRLDTADLLVNEAHHRVKNSLQLIAAILHLQARRHPAPTALRDGLLQASQRVRAVAQVHERLQRGAVAELDAGAYLRDLGAELSCSLGLPASRGVAVEALQVPLRPDRLLALGLIATELVTNAVKHGLAGQGGVEVRVVLAPGPDGTLRLLVADSGPGLPEGVLRGSAGGLGIDLVRHLARVLGGWMEIDGTPPGARVTVRFARDAAARPGRDGAGSGSPCA